MKRFFVLALLSLALASCEKGQNVLKKTLKGLTGSCFEVSLYSGGKKVETFYTEFVNSEEKSDGWYFSTIDGKFVLLSGNVVVKEVDKKFCEGR